MIRTSEVAKRYAKALFDIANESKKHSEIFDQLRAFAEALSKDKTVLNFFISPLTQPEAKEKSLKAALQAQGISPEFSAFVLLLFRKNRLSQFPQIAEAFQGLSDEANKVTRGEVSSAYALSQEENKQLEEIVSKVTQKKVILTYKQDAHLIGGLRAQVGSYSFDDSIETHLNRLKDELKRRAN
jgi:F-type H+-transporting ATPase subunit delta